MPQGWPGAGAAPYENMIGRDMRLRDPEEGDYRPLEGSPAEAYGCQTFDLGPAETRAEPASWSPAPARRAGRIEVGGVLAGDTVWDADVVRVIDGVEIPADGSLSIAAGVRVEFAGFHRLLVRGRLRAEGTAAEPITFAPAAGHEAEGWDGIDFLNPPAAGPGSRLAHCLFSGAVARAAEQDRGRRVAGGIHQAQTGGALSIIGGNNLTVTACTFADNRAEYGGAVFVGHAASPVLAGNLFTQNRATLGGSALASVYAYPKLVNNTIVDNVCEAESAFHLCAAVENFNGKLDLSGNIIRDNFTPHYSGVQVLHEKAFYTRHNNIAGFAGGEGNLDLDPLFMGSGAHPLRLLAGSPCLDAGIENLWTQALDETDPAGSNRRMGAALDMGCYEFGDQLAPVTQVSGAGTVLHQSTPNPASGGRGTLITFELPAAAAVTLDIFDIRGHRVRRLLASALPAGGHAASWNGKDTRGERCAAGVYFYRLEAGGRTLSRRLVLTP